MCKFSKLIILSLICLIFSGCYQSTPVPTESVPETLPFEFPLPNGYTLTPKSDNAISIIQNGQVIGGIIRTDLDVSCITDTNCTHISEYLKSFASPPLFADYINMYFDGIAYITLQISDRETGPVSNQSHTLFERDAVCFDYWVDSALVTDEERDSIFKSILGK